MEFHPQRSFVNLSSRWRQAGQPHERSSRNDVPAGDMPSASGSIHGCRRREQRETNAHREPPPAPAPRSPGSSTTSVRSFLLAKGVKGPFTPVNFPGAPMTLVAGLNDRVQLVGSYQNARAMAGPQSTGMPLGRTS